MTINEKNLFRNIEIGYSLLKVSEFNFEMHFELEF